MDGNLESTGYGVFTYENTSEFSMELPNADYRVTVTFVNPTDADYSAYIESEEITKVESTAIAAGGSATVGYTAVLVDGRLDIKFLAASSATSESDAATRLCMFPQWKLQDLRQMPQRQSLRYLSLLIPLYRPMTAVIILRPDGDR